MVALMRERNAEAEVAEVTAWAAGLDALAERIAGRFGRSEPRRRARSLTLNVGRMRCAL